MVKRYFIHTFGCQMNVSDSSRMGEVLAGLNYVPTPTFEEADLIILNTCSIQEKARLLRRAPFVDFVFGPDASAKLPEILTRLERQRVPVVETAWMDSEEYVFPRAHAETARGKVTEFVTVMKGCDNVCSFCVVPHTRGREVS